MPVRLPIVVENGGLFVSPGTGIHPDRVIKSHELILVRSGLLSMWEEQRRFDVSEGETLILWPGRRHRGAAAYQPDLSFYWLHFRVLPSRPPAKIQKALALELPQLAKPVRPDRMAELFHRFLDDQESARLTPLSAGLLVLQMFAEMTLVGTDSSAASPAARLLASRAEAHITANLHEQLSASRVAEALEVNPDYLTRMFGVARGQTITQFIHARRLREARALLRETTLNMKQIADRCGFCDAAYLRRLFARQEGMNPRAYRKLYMRTHVNVR